MIDFENKPAYGISDLLSLMKILRGPQGCPWDRRQTHKSIRRNLLEEAYELADAIDREDTANLIEELGDVLLQVIFHAEIAKDGGSFTFGDVVDATCRKLLRRHPHVFGSAEAQDGEQSLSLWEEAKREEKNHQSISDSMEDIARTLPALWQAEKIQKKAAKAGFDWPDYTGALEALRGEVTELQDALAQGNSDAAAGELGDVLFSAVNVARLLDIDPEAALLKSGSKFVSRFRHIEEAAAADGKDLSKMTLEEMEIYYRQSKSS